MSTIPEDVKKKIEDRYPIFNSLSQKKRDAAEFGYQLAMSSHCRAGSSTPDEWISIKDELPKKYKYGEPEMWKLCLTEFGAALLSLCYYDTELKKWIDGSGKTEERVERWKDI